jgi:hypothetical protein
MSAGGRTRLDAAGLRRCRGRQARIGAQRSAMETVETGDNGGAKGGSPSWNTVQGRGGGGRRTRIPQRTRRGATAPIDRAQAGKPARQQAPHSASLLRLCFNHASELHSSRDEEIPASALENSLLCLFTHTSRPFGLCAAIEFVLLGLSPAPIAVTAGTCTAMPEHALNVGHRELARVLQTRSRWQRAI